MIDVKIGDVVHVAGRVVSLDNEEIQIDVPAKRPSERTWSVWVGPSQILHVEPRPVEVGDQVEWNGTTQCVVRAIEGEEAWVLRPDGTHFTANVSLLEHAS